MPSHRPWYGDGLRFTCTRSGRCCTNHGDYDHVYFTRDEERAVARHLHIAVRELRRRHIALEDGYRVARSRGDACTFFRDGECEIYPIRPVPCRTWPFWPELVSRRSWANEVLSFCPGAGRGKLHSKREIDSALRRKRAHDRALEDDR